VGTSGSAARSAPDGVQGTSQPSGVPTR